jgi:hypothetical protein
MYWLTTVYISTPVESAPRGPARAVVISRQQTVSLVGVASAYRDRAGYVMTLLVANAVCRAARVEVLKRV